MLFAYACSTVVTRFVPLEDKYFVRSNRNDLPERNFSTENERFLSDIQAETIIYLEVYMNSRNVTVANLRNEQHFSCKFHNLWSPNWESASSMN
jgi:hypothetical protein